MKRSDRRRHAGANPTKTHWLIDHQILDIRVEMDGHEGVVNLVAEVDPDSRQITSWEFLPHPTDTPTAPDSENPGR